ncbi:FAD-dependent oxidoreductase [Staphylococcus capitis]|uniref:FAD-dependent oxidoreductase n=1 Tax=Staphylococcus capitis TaxID=29388 RepID=UPI00064A714E|nr:FAD-dependent oxidoreductase [Staphylococcus capitis]AKL92868.1 NADH peroxidase [Staphylococcus capitis subsp. capitis]MCC0829922.1 FAD-dependent oxidoreductase [Staphylococcus capitis]MCC3743701.1 FAD-dependent oxidoreductase [Staphylococcus capitis]MDS0929865.1 FAD-dependent oxidoreductase [Staphylococcus capitis]NMK81552.1 FAD-dependent oxidoreductase [Staphylococcus capitis]
MKYVVVGTSHAGYEVIETLLKEDSNAEIHVFESGDKPSFLSCGIQSYLENVSPSLDSLHYASEASYKEQGVNIHVNSTVTDLDTDKKVITVEQNGQSNEVTYDKLFLSPGGKPVTPPIDGIDQYNNVLFMRGREWADQIKQRMPQAKKAVVVGGGYIGIEAAEAFAKAGIETTIVDIADRILNTYLDQEFTDILQQNSEKHDLYFKGGETVQSLSGDDNGNVTKVVTDKNEYEADTVLFAVGVTPATEWLDGKIELGEKGIINIDHQQQTSAKDVYAGGDATLVPFAPVEEDRYIALATNSRRQGVVAAKNMTGKNMTMPRVSGTSGLQLFDYKFGQTGVHGTEVDSYDGNLGQKYVEELIHPKFMQDETTIHMKIIYDEDSHQILGGQVMSTEDVTASINTISMAISAGYTLEQLAVQDFFFQPDYDRPWNYLNVLAQQALGDTFGSDKMLF